MRSASEVGRQQTGLLHGWQAAESASRSAAGRNVPEELLWLPVIRSPFKATRMALPENEDRLENNTLFRGTGENVRSM
jgi:hypothetical protein